MSSRSLAVRKSGEIRPGLENGAIRALRTALETDTPIDRRAALAELESPQDAQWRELACAATGDAAPKLVRKALYGTFDVYAYRGCWYAILTCEQTFDPVQAKAGIYQLCLRTQTLHELQRWLQRLVWRRRVGKLVKTGLQWSKKLARTGLAAIGIQTRPPRAA